MGEPEDDMANDESASILLVDDSPEKLLALETVLESLGQRLVRASSGREALRCLMQRDVDERRGYEAWRRDARRRIELGHQQCLDGETVDGAAVLVEFSDPQGRAYAIVPCPRSELLVRHQVPQIA